MWTREGRGTQMGRPSIIVVMVIDHHPAAATRLALRGPSGEELAPLLSRGRGGGACLEGMEAWGAGPSHQGWQIEQSMLCVSLLLWFCPQQ